MGRVVQSVFKPQIQAPAPPPPPPSPTSSNPQTAQATQAAQQKAADEELKKGKSRAATIFTSAQGDTSEASVSRRVLLGA